MSKDENSPKKSKKVLDTVSPKRGRGRPFTVDPSAVKGRADNYQGIFEHVSEQLWPDLLAANSEEDVVCALRKALEYEKEFTPSVPLIFKLLKDPSFPKRRHAQIRFLADSIAGLGRVTPRRARDICAAERAREERTHHIIRYEYYVECSCGYEGPSLNHACKECGAAISEDWLP
jgi:hypothetical protein